MTAPIIRTASRTGTTAGAPTVRPEWLSRILVEHRYRHRVSLYASAFTKRNDLPWNRAKHYSVEKVLYMGILSRPVKSGKGTDDNAGLHPSTS